jgi:hypothetical protein
MSSTGFGRSLIELSSCTSELPLGELILLKKFHIDWLAFISVHVTPKPELPIALGH